MAQGHLRFLKGFYHDGCEGHLGHVIVTVNSFGQVERVSSSNHTFFLGTVGVTVQAKLSRRSPQD